MGAASKIPKVGEVFNTIASTLTDYISPVAGLISGMLCFDMTFFIGENPYKAANEYGGLYDFAIIAKQGIVDTSKFTNFKASLDKPESLPKTTFWKRVYNDIAPAAKKQITRGAKTVSGAKKR